MLVIKKGSIIPAYARIIHVNDSLIQNILVHVFHVTICFDRGDGAVG